MSVTDRPVGDVVVIDIEGDMINNKEYGSVKRRVGELVGQGHLSLLLNLSQVPYMNSWGVGELATSFHPCAQSSRHAEGRRLSEPGYADAGDLKTRYRHRRVRH